MKLCDNDSCTGCAACYNVCPQKAIYMQPDAEGFLRPEVDNQKCVNCGLCEHVCPQLEKSKLFPKEEKEVYASWLKSKRLLRKSTSGGAFTALSKAILRQSGIVYGAGFGEHLKVKHKRIDSEAGLSELRGSKYVQSEIGDTYRNVERDIKDGKKVLFTGTPCQIDALYRMLGERHEGQLYTIDLVCHGVPSPMIYADYLKYMECKYNGHSKYITFRDKNPGWYIFGMQIAFDNGVVYQQDNWHDPFHRGFLRNLFLRPSCHHCIYTNTNRPADITLADDWGYRETGFKDRDNDQGISMVMINSSNGKHLFELAKRHLKVFPRELDNAVRGNPALNRPFEMPDNRSGFWADYKALPFSDLIDKYCYGENVPEGLGKRMDRIKANRRDEIKHLPNRVLIRVLGFERYNKVKSAIKGIIR